MNIDGFDALADLIAQYPPITQTTHFVLVPGPHDLTLNSILPRRPIMSSFTSKLKNKIPKIHFASNPCRIKFFDQEIVIFREDLMSKILRNTIGAKPDISSSDLKRYVCGLTHFKFFSDVLPCCSLCRQYLIRCTLVPSLWISNLCWLIMTMLWDCTLYQQPSVRCCFCCGRMGTDIIVSSCWQTNTTGINWPTWAAMFSTLARSRAILLYSGCTNLQNSIRKSGESNLYKQSLADLLICWSVLDIPTDDWPTIGVREQIGSKNSWTEYW